MLVNLARVCSSYRRKSEIQGLLTRKDNRMLNMAIFFEGGTRGCFLLV